MRTSGIPAVPSSALVLLASSSSPAAVPMSGIMEPPAILEDGSAPENRRSKHLRVAFRALLFVLIIISVLVPIVFCLLYHQQAPGSCWAHGSLNKSSPQDPRVLIWKWDLHHCKGIVQGQGKYLIIQQSGRYFIYAQFYRKNTLKAYFSVMLYRNKMDLNNAVGPENGTVSFARPFSLQKGDELHFEKNDEERSSLLEEETYWGLFKM